ncbi:hypothetical protein C5749_02480 [Sphingobacterium gobiense]|uniref:Uncharacterized protein n=1 Tax=Sphingobacterium gobiense TaxID=1382456 RepID=A0A2S9JSP4_9SPHI|nr:hypothetical protein C5749_02480 [Sphingobacterium gobiense]
MHVLNREGKGKYFYVLFPREKEPKPNEVSSWIPKYTLIHKTRRFGYLTGRESARKGFLQLSKIRMRHWRVKEGIVHSEG